MLQPSGHTSRQAAMKVCFTLPSICAQHGLEFLQGPHKACTQCMCLNSEHCYKHMLLTRRYFRLHVARNMLHWSFLAFALGINTRLDPLVGIFMLARSSGDPLNHTET